MTVATADIVILTPPPNSKRVAVVRIFNVANLQPEHGNDRQGYMRLTGGAASYFLLVSQDSGYIWTEGSDIPVRFDMSPVIRRFIPNITPGHRMFGMDVATLVSFWLSELTGEWRVGDEEPEKTLASVGFLDQVRGSTVYSETAA